ncbi:MAG: multicomponent Na+:H+ antiporter subunit A [Myxococcota bacterium]|jgi:multicomponent Na+:H+ antiporter subunit A
MFIVLTAILVTSVVAGAIHPRHPRLAGVLCGVLLATVTGWLAFLEPGAVLVSEFEWVPAIGVSFALRLDGLGRLFGLLIAGVGAVLMPYAASYFANKPRAGRTLGTLMAFSAAMLGLVWADDLIAMFVFWEITSVASYILIGHDHARAEARDSARRALLITGGGGLVLLTGLLVLGTNAGAWRFSEIGSQVGQPGYALAAVLIIVGAMTKSAQFPFHFWLPGAMAAPTPVSAYLHSATMVKAGVYLLLRTTPALGGSVLWTSILVTTGSITALLAGYRALHSRDLKRLLAWTTCSALGLLTLLVGIGTQAALAAACGFVLVHGLYKATLFMTAGTLDKRFGTRDMLKLNGVLSAAPVTGWAILLAGAAMAALAPTLGFAVKEALLAELGAFAIVGVVTIGAFAAAAAIALGTILGWPGRREQRATVSVSPELTYGPLLIAIAGVVLGLLSTSVGPNLIAPATSVVATATVPVTLGLWHGFNVPLAISGLTVLLGLALAVRWMRNRDQLGVDAPTLFERQWPRAIAQLDAFAKWQTRLLMGGTLSRDIAVVIGVAVLLPLFVGLRHGLPPLPTLSGGAVSPAFFVVALVVGAAALAVPFARRRSTTVMALGAVGMGMALIFVLVGAPDLAITQVVVEALVVVIALRVIGLIPRSPRSSHSATALALAIASSLCVMFLMLVALSVGGDTHVNDAMAALAVAEANGRNIVNVILVDFRALDTLGEVTVLALAALGALSLVANRRSSTPLKGGSQ